MNGTGVPPMVTTVAPVKALPLIVTVAPILPEPGLNDETLGITPKLGPDALPAGVVTLIGPVSAPDGPLIFGSQDLCPRHSSGLCGPCRGGTQVPAIDSLGLRAHLAGHGVVSLEPEPGIHF